MLLIGCAVFALQCAGTLMAYFAESARDFGGAVKVLGDPNPLPGTDVPVRAIWVERFHGFRPDAAFTLRDTNGDISIDGPSNVLPFGSASLPVASEIASYTLTADVPGAPEPRAVPFALRPADDTSWLNEGRRFRGGGDVHRVPHTPAHDDPHVTIAENDGDTCPLGLYVTAATGSFARMVNNRLIAALIDGNDRPVAGATLSWSGPDDTTRTTVTDVFGLAAFDMVPLADERWSVTFDCNGAAIERHVDIVATWDGIRVGRDDPTIIIGQVATWHIEQQRDWGTWFYDLVCDGHWVDIGAGEVRGGHSVLALDVPMLPLPDTGVRLCALQTMRNVNSSDPPRAVHNVLVRGPNVTDVQAVRLLAEAWRVQAPDCAQRGLCPNPSVFAIADAPSIRALGLWLLSNLPESYQPLPLLADDRISATTAFEEKQAQSLQTLRTILVLDALLLLLVIGLVLVPPAIAQRRVMRDLIDDDASDYMEVGLAQLTVADRYRDIAVIILGFGVVLSILIGLLVLVVYL